LCEGCISLCEKDNHFGAVGDNDVVIIIEKYVGEIYNDIDE